MDELNKHVLDFDKTYYYFIDHIDSERALPDKIIEKNDFRLGSFFTLLPSYADLSRIYKFPYGGILPPGENCGKIHIKSLGYVHAERIRSIDNELSQFVLNYLEEKDDHVCVVESYNPTSDSPHVNIKNVDMVPYEKEVYYFLYRNNSREEILQTIRKSHTFWHFLLLLTSLETRPTHTLKDQDLDEICANTKFIVGGAYDREGYIFWKRAN